MTLALLPLGSRARVTGLDLIDEAQGLRLACLGLRPGVTVEKLLRTPLRDPVECLVGSQLLAIEESLLARIRVEALLEDPAS